MAWNISDNDLAALIAAMTSEEKVATVSGAGIWRTTANYRLNVPELLMTDGTYGVRYSIEQIDGIQDDHSQLSAFLSVVNADASGGVEATFGSTRPATCFPNGSSFACSWDVGLARELGAALAAECRAFGVNLLLGPGINIRRTPLAGRSYEYYSEDPVLSGDIAAAVIEGLQANGVGASLKHFACNNSEVQRTTMDSVVEERALREIYLKGFERAIRKSDPWTVMSSYNRLNGVQAAENHWLLTTVLREEWGYKGVVVSDWHGIKDRPASLQAGNDLDMPESGTRKAQLLEAVENGRIDKDTLDSACMRVLQLVRKVRQPEDRGVEFDRQAHHALARRMAAESIVLLKNEGSILPLDARPGMRIVVVGEGATAPTIQGSGCATTTPTGVDTPLDHIRKLAGGDVRVDFFRGTGETETGREALIAEAETGADGADAVILFVSTENGYDGEGSDRRTLDLAPGQDELVDRLAAATPNLVVAIASPDAVTMPWIDRVPAVLEMFYSGQGMGAAVADILFGRVNPSGKLTTTFPRRLEEVPAFLDYPGENDRHLYGEGLHVGYRSYDARHVEPLFPFGFGLSYTRFDYSALELHRTVLRPSETVAASFTVTNSGTMEGKEVCQLYVRHGRPRLKRPVRELKGFAKVHLMPGESRRVVIEVEAHDLRFFDPGRGDWVLDNDRISIEIGASSRDIRLSGEMETASPVLPYRRVEWDTQPVFVLENPIARRHFNAYLQEKLTISETEADHLLVHCANSFVGIFTTFDRRFRQSFPRAEGEALLARIDAAMREAESSPSA